VQELLAAVRPRTHLEPSFRQEEQAGILLALVHEDVAVAECDHAHALGQQPALVLVELLTQHGTVQDLRVHGCGHRPNPPLGAGGGPSAAGGVAASHAA